MTWLKQADKDGGFMYSSTISLNFSVSASLHFNVIDNAGKNYFSVQQNGNINFDKAFILVRNIAGQTLIKEALANTGSQVISSSALVNGTYFYDDL